MFLFRLIMMLKKYYENVNCMKCQIDISYVRFIYTSYKIGYGKYRLFLLEYI